MAVKLFTGGTKTVATAGTSVQLSSSNRLGMAIIIQADNANSGTIYVGDSTVASSNGLQLTAGQTLTLTGPIRAAGGAEELMPSDIYIDASVNSQKVFWAFIDKQ